MILLSPRSFALLVLLSCWSTSCPSLFFLPYLGWISPLLQPLLQKPQQSRLRNLYQIQANIYFLGQRPQERKYRRNHQQFLLTVTETKYAAIVGYDGSTPVPCAPGLKVWKERRDGQTARTDAMERETKDTAM